MDRTKAIDRAAKIFALMQSEQTYGNEAAVLNFGAALQRLMLEHDIEEADIEAHQSAGTTRASEPLVEQPINRYTLGVGESGKRNAALEDLALFVGKAHLCKILLRPGSNWLAFVGTESHIKVAELVLGVMWKSLQKMAKQGYRQAKQDGADLRNYNGTFKRSFVWRLAARYEQEQRDIITEQDIAQSMREREARGGAGADVELGDYPAPAQSTALAVVNRELERVGSYIREHYGKSNARSIGNGYSSGNSRASSDGSAAANRVPLRSNSVGSGSRNQLGA